MNEKTQEASDGALVEEGHERIFRLTAVEDGRARETRYFKDAYETRQWRNSLREAGYEAQAALAPASAFQVLDDETLDGLAEETLLAFQSKRSGAGEGGRRSDWVPRLKEKVLEEGGTWTGKRAMEYLHSIGFNCTIERARQCMKRVEEQEPGKVAVSEGRRWVWEVR